MQRDPPIQDKKIVKTKLAAKNNIYPFYFEQSYLFVS